MALVTVKIAGQNHALGCEDGQELHLQAMAGEVERRVTLARSVAGTSASEARLLVLAALMLADELYDLRAEVASNPGIREVIKEVVREVRVEVPVEVPVADSVLHAKLEALALRAEEIAAGLEHA